MKIHWITDFKTLYPHAFSELLTQYRIDIEKYKYGSWVCEECDTINPVYYYSSTETHKSFREDNNDRLHTECIACGENFNGNYQENRVNVE